MNYFDVLLVANAIMAVVALYQLRLCTLILAGNGLLVSRALASIQRGGQPASQWFLPAYVFSDENLSIAAGIMTISLATLVGFTLLTPDRRRVRIGTDAPAVPKAVLGMIVVYLLAYLGSSTTILTGGYAVTAESQRYNFELAGAHALLCSLVLYEVSRRRLLEQITARRAFLAIFCSIGLVHYLRGATGITTGYLVAAAVLLLPRTGAAKRIGNVARIAAVMLAILLCSLVVRGVRVTLHSEGSEAVSAFLDGALALEADRDDNAEGIESAANASQSATLMLMCITLYESGMSREWRSMYNVVEYTFMPSFLARWFDWTRSQDAPEGIREAGFIHGGGINVLGEFYWNGGWVCVVIMATALSLFASIVDRKYRESPFWLMMAVQWAPSLLMGYGYGLAQVSRGAINGLVVAAAYKVFILIRRQQPNEASAALPGIG